MKRYINITKRGEKNAAQAAIALTTNCRKSHRLSNKSDNHELFPDCSTHCHVYALALHVQHHQKDLPITLHTNCTSIRIQWAQGIYPPKQHTQVPNSYPSCCFTLPHSFLTVRLPQLFISSALMTHPMPFPPVLFPSVPSVFKQHSKSFCQLTTPSVFVKTWYIPGNTFLVPAHRDFWQQTASAGLLVVAPAASR